MKTTDRLLSAARKIWESYNDHPFVMGLQNGTLDREKFRYYIIQDFLYLKDYARVFALGVAMAQSAETAQLFARFIAVMNGEMNLHDGYLGKFGVTQAEIERTKPALDNLSYTAYMLRVAYEESEAEILTAVLSCAYSYEVIARKMLKTIQQQPMIRFTATGSRAMPQKITPPRMCFF